MENVLGSSQTSSGGAHSLHKISFIYIYLIGAHDRIYPLEGVVYKLGMSIWIGLFMGVTFFPPSF